MAQRELAIINGSRLAQDFCNKFTNSQCVNAWQGRLPPPTLQLKQSCRGYQNHQQSRYRSHPGRSVSHVEPGHHDRRTYHRQSQLSTLLSTHWFHTITTMLKQTARDICNDRLLYILEGGYNPVALKESVLATIDSLLQPNGSRVGVLHSERANTLLKNHPLNQFWTL